MTTTAARTAIAEDLLERHDEVLQGALAAILSREWFSAYSESPNGYGDGAAAAIVAARAEPAPRRKRPLSVWELLPRVEPTLSEWAAFFAAGAGKRAAAEAGLPRAVSAREADDLLRDAATFVSLAESALGAPGQPLLPLSAAV